MGKSEAESGQQKMEMKSTSRIESRVCGSDFLSRIASPFFPDLKD